MTSLFSGLRPPRNAEEAELLIKAIQETKEAAERVILVLDFVRDWPRELAASVLTQAGAQMTLLARDTDATFTIDDLIAKLRLVAEETFKEIAVRTAQRPV